MRQQLLGGTFQGDHAETVQNPDQVDPALRITTPSQSWSSLLNPAKRGSAPGGPERLLLIEMLENPSLLKVHCETHDDIVLVREKDDSVTRIAEFVQVKANEPDKLWSVADLCRQDYHKAGTSIFERSLARDIHREESRFRLVTLRQVVSDLEILTWPHGAPERGTGRVSLDALQSEFDSRFPGQKSKKGNGTVYWLENCRWDQCHSEDAVRRDNLVRLLTLSGRERRQLLPEPAEELLEELRQRAKAAGSAKWDPDSAQKIITRQALRGWWDQRTREIIEGAAVPSGGKLRTKMTEVGLPDDLIQLAIDMRREYTAIVRTPRYMEPDECERLQGRVKSVVLSLRASYVADQLGLEDLGFHALCLERMDVVNADRPAGSEDRAAFLKGCMYDIADRCLLRFARNVP